MKLTSKLEMNLDEVLQDETIMNHVRKLLEDSAQNNIVTVRFEEEDLDIPVNVPLFLITKAFFKEYFEINFSQNTLQALISLGDVTNEPPGIIASAFCFCTLYFDENGNLITSDLHREFR